MPAYNRQANQLAYSQLTEMSTAVANSSGELKGNNSRTIPLPYADEGGIKYLMTAS